MFFIRFLKAFFLVLSVELLFTSAILLTVQTHTLLYKTWVRSTNYTSEYYSESELIRSQKIYWDSIFVEFPSHLTLTEKEILHTKDIVRLIIWFYVYAAVLTGTMLGLLTSKHVRTYVLKRRFRIHFIMLSTLCVVLVITTFGLFFEKYFLLFHHLVFDNDFWLLPAEALLLNIYPPVLFFYMVLLALTYALFIGIVVITISYLIENVYGKKT